LKIMIRSQLARNYRHAQAGILMAAQRLRFASLREPTDGWPIVLNISFPKSGTNLMVQVLEGFSKVAPFVYPVLAQFGAFDARSGAQRTEQDASDFLHSLHPGYLAKCHLPAWPAVVEQVSTRRFLPYFIYRDPRDVAVSHVFYVMELAEHHHLHAYYNRRLNTFDERLMASILGAEDTGSEFPNVAERFAPYADWLDCPQVLSLRYEQFVDDRRGTLSSVADHFVGRVDTLKVGKAELVDALESSIDPKRSHTFRSGKTGEWRRYFTEEHKLAFKDVAADLLIRLGYEQDSNW
jgi:sulfotransferase family protein